MINERIMGLIRGGTTAEMVNIVPKEGELVFVIISDTQFVLKIGNGKDRVDSLPLYLGMNYSIESMYNAVLPYIKRDFAPIGELEEDAKIRSIVKDEIIRWLGTSREQFELFQRVKDATKLDPHLSEETLRVRKAILDSVYSREEIDKKLMKFERLQKSYDELLTKIDIIV